ncbi:MAG: hypothetical protein ABI406_14935 [Ktedonobacteraceae bacterium]
MNIFTGSMPLFAFIVASIVGIFVFVITIRVSHPEIQASLKAGSFQRQYWQKQLGKWGIVFKEPAEALELQEVEQSWKTLQPVPGMILFLVLMLLAFILIILNIPLLWFYLIMSGLFVCILLIRGWSYITGLARLREKANRRITYSDLRQRRLSDYRWSPFRWLIITAIVFAIVVTVFAFPYLPVTLFAQIPGGPSVSLPQVKWLITGMNVAMLLICATAEILTQYVATFSRLLVTSNPPIARQVDDMFRSKAICELQGDEFTAIAYLFIIQFVLLAFAVFDYFPGYLHPIFWFGLVLAALLMVSGLTSYGLNGRLGGSISRWPWQQGAQS